MFNWDSTGMSIANDSMKYSQNPNASSDFVGDGWLDKTQSDIFTATCDNKVDLPCLQWIKNTDIPLTKFEHPIRIAHLSRLDKIYIDVD